MFLFDIIFYLIFDAKKDFKDDSENMRKIEKTVHSCFLIFEMILLIVINIAWFYSYDESLLINKYEKYLFVLLIIVLVFHIFIYRKIKKRIKLNGK